MYASANGSTCTSWFLSLGKQISQDQYFTAPRMWLLQADARRFVPTQHSLLWPPLGAEVAGGKGNFHALGMVAAVL